MIRVIVRLKDRSCQSIVELQTDSLQVVTWLTFHDETRELKVIVLGEDSHVRLLRPLEVKLTFVSLLSKHRQISDVTEDRCIVRLKLDTLSCIHQKILSLITFILLHIVLNLFDIAQ